MPSNRLMDHRCSCCAGGNASACAQAVFNDLYYNPSTGAVVAPGTPGAVTGAAAFQQGNGKILNINTSMRPPTTVRHTTSAVWICR
jgi:hypothetical protein